MNKEQFNQLNIIEQMTYINDLLTSMSLTKACESIGIDRATVRKRFKNKEISFNKDLNQYIFDKPIEKYGIEASKNTLDTVVNNKPIEAKIKKIEPTKESKRLLDLESKVSILEIQIENIKELLKTTTNTITTYSNIRTFEGEEVVRSFRLNKDIQERFKRYCKTSDYKVSDILNTILEDFLNSKGAK